VNADEESSAYPLESTDSILQD